jgi:DNA polymerase I
LGGAVPVANTTEQVERIIDDLARLGPRDAVAIDTETTGVDLWKGDVIRGISIAYGESGWYIPISHPDSQNVSADAARRIATALDDTDALPILHNAPFDWQSLSQVGMPRTPRYWDTQLVSWLMDENTTHTLKGLGAMIFGEDERAEQMALKALFKGESTQDVYKRLRAEGWPVQAARLEAKDLAQASRKTWATLTACDIAPYAEQDARLTLRLYEWQRRQLAKGGDTDPTPDLQRKHDFQLLVDRMVQRGVGVDVEAIERNRAASLARIWEIEPAFEGVNLNSPKQLAKMIYEDWGLEIPAYTPTGNPSTSRETLEQLEGAHENLDLLLEYRRLAKRVSTYYDNLLAGADANGRVHPGFCCTCTVTGRLSARNPNLMNLPRGDTDPEVKTVFRPTEGMELWEFDLKSAELFVGASIAQDDDMLAALESEGRDFHTETAMAIFGNAEGNNRTLAKNLNYGIPYGIGPTKFANYVVKGTGRAVTEQDVRYSRYLIQRHRMTWPRTHVAIDRMSAFAKAHGYLPLKQPGRFRHFRSPGVLVPAYTAFNAAVQGGVAEVMQSWMLNLEDPLGELGASMCLQVHDSLWLETPPGSEVAVTDLLQRVLDDVNPYRARLTIDSKRIG